MQQIKEKVLNVCFSIFIIIIFSMKYFNKLTSILDNILAFIAIICSTIILISENSALLDIAHFLYCFVYFFLVSFFSNNKYLLVLNILMIIIVICSRYYFSSCILNTKQCNEGYFIDVNKKFKEKIPFWNWNYIFPFFLIVSARNLLNHTHFKQITDTITKVAKPNNRERINLDKEKIKLNIEEINPSKGVINKVVF